MPNLTIHMPADQMPKDDRLAALTDQCTELCTGTLMAALANVHVTYVGVTHGRGHPVFAQVRYRLDPVRTPSVMEAFMERLDEAIFRHTGLTARIRCFGYAAAQVHARN